MKQAILIRGASASGKSTTTNTFIEKHSGFVNVHLDDYRRESGLEDHRAQREYAYEKGIEQLKRLTSEGKAIIIDEMFRPEFYKPVVALLEESGYRIINVLIKTSLESLSERDAARKIPIGKKRLETLAKRAESIEEELRDALRGEQIVIDEGISLEEAVSMIEAKLDLAPGSDNSEITKVK